MFTVVVVHNAGLQLVAVSCFLPVYLGLIVQLRSILEVRSVDPNCMPGSRTEMLGGGLKPA